MPADIGKGGWHLRHRWSCELRRRHMSAAERQLAQATTRVHRRPEHVAARPVQRREAAEYVAIADPETGKVYAVGLRLDEIHTEDFGPAASGVRRSHGGWDGGPSRRWRLALYALAGVNAGLALAIAWLVGAYSI